MEPSLQDVIDLSVGKVNEHKLRQITQRLETALGGPLASQRLDDPILIRRQLVAQLRVEGASLGTIQALEQFFMGVVRRAAVEGLIPAPPEGPWTRAWQTVLGESPRHRSRVRALAAWATERGWEPSDVDARRLREWAMQSNCGEATHLALRSLLSGLPKASQERIRESSSVLTQRLKMKAARGTVRTTND